MPINNGGARNFAGFQPPNQAKDAFIIVFDSKKDEKTKKLGPRKRKVANQLAFINATDSGQPPSSARELIRTHVMSDYWRKQVLKKSRNYQPSVSNVNNQDLPYVTNVFTKPPILPDLFPQPLNGPDPFSRLPIEMKPFMYIILDRYATEITHEICSRTDDHENHLSQCPKLRWLRIGLSDAAVLRSLLCVSALHIDVTDGKGFSPHRYALKRDAVRTISERLSETQSGVSDETITAVTLLAIEEGVALNFGDWGSHMKGLKRMVDLRGGLSKLDDELHTLIHIADLHGCDGQSVKQYFPWIKASACQTRYTNLSYCPGTSKGPAWGIDLEGFDEHLLASFSVVRNLTAAINKASEDGTEIDRFVVDAAIIWIRSRLSASVSIKREVEQQNMYALCCLGIQIYLTTITDHCEAELDQSDLISKLKSHLSHVDTTAMLSPLVLWTIFFGGMASQTCEDRSLFVILLRQLSHALNFPDWSSMSPTLKSLAWVDKKHDELGRLLWNTTIASDPFRL